MICSRPAKQRGGGVATSFCAAAHGIEGRGNAGGRVRGSATSRISERGDASINKPLERTVWYRRTAGLYRLTGRMRMPSASTSTLDEIPDTPARVMDSVAEDGPKLVTVNPEIARRSAKRWDNELHPSYGAGDIWRQSTWEVPTPNQQAAFEAIAFAWKAGLGAIFGCSVARSPYSRDRTLALYRRDGAHPIDRPAASRGRNTVSADTAAAAWNCRAILSLYGLRAPPLTPCSASGREAKRQGSRLRRHIGGDFHPFGCDEHLDGTPRGDCARCSF